MDTSGFITLTVTAMSEVSVYQATAGWKLAPVGSGTPQHLLHTSGLCLCFRLDHPDLWVEIPDGGMLADVELGTDEWQMVEVS